MLQAACALFPCGLFERRECWLAGNASLKLYTRNFNLFYTKEAPVLMLRPASGALCPLVQARHSTTRVLAFHARALQRCAYIKPTSSLATPLMPQTSLQVILSRAGLSFGLPFGQSRGSGRLAKVKFQDERGPRGIEARLTRTLFSVLLRMWR